MILQFDLEITSDEEKEIIPEFLVLLVKEIRQEIYNSCSLQKLAIREEYLINCKWMTWKEKPSSINMKNLLMLILNNVKIFQIRKGFYRLTIDNKEIVPGTWNTKVIQVAKFLDKGAIGIPPMNFIVPVFNKYRTEIPFIWKRFVQLKIKKGDFINECLRIR